MRTVITFNQKGGVGKSNVAFHLAHYLSERHRVLAIDLDAQEAAVSHPLRAHASTAEAIHMFAAPSAAPPSGQLTLASRMGRAIGRQAALIGVGGVGRRLWVPLTSAH